MSIAPESNNAPSPGFSPGFNPRSPDTTSYIVFNRVFYIVMASTCALLVFFMACTFCICKKLRAREGLAFITVEKRKPFCKHRNAWTFPQIEEATDNFSIDRSLGKGRHGRVYAATLPDGQVIAVKRIDPSLVLRHAPDFSLSARISAETPESHQIHVTYAADRLYFGSEILVALSRPVQLLNSNSGFVLQNAFVHQLTRGLCQSGGSLIRALQEHRGTNVNFSQLQTSIMKPSGS